MKKAAISLLIAIIAVAWFATQANCEDRVVKVKMPDFISETETTGITGVNNPIKIEDLEYNEEVEKKLKELDSNQVKPEAK